MHALYIGPAQDDWEIQLLAPDRQMVDFRLPLERNAVEEDERICWYASREIFFSSTMWRRYSPVSSSPISAGCRIGCLAKSRVYPR